MVSGLWKGRWPFRSRDKPAGPSAAALDVMGDWVTWWCRLLNAFPDVEKTLAFDQAAASQYDGLAGRWTRQRGEDGYLFFSAEGHGRFSPGLPHGVRPQDVVEVDLDIDPRATPGRDQLAGFVANIELAIGSGWQTSASTTLAGARRVLDTDETSRIYGEWLASFCGGALETVGLEGVDELHADEVERRAFLCRDLLGALAFDAERRFQVYEVDALIVAHVLIVRDVCLARAVTADSPVGASAALLQATLFVLAKGLTGSADGREKATGMAMEAVTRILREGRENALTAAIESVQSEGDVLMNQALTLTDATNEPFVALLYASVPYLRAWHQLGRYLVALCEEFPAVGTPKFRREVSQARRVAEEKVIRVQDSLIENARDLFGETLGRDRDRVMGIRANEGAYAAELAAIELTVGWLRYPRGAEPYLCGQSDQLTWRQR